MKKFLAILVAVTAVLGTFTACGKDDTESSSVSVSESSASTTDKADESSEPETEAVTTETVTEEATTVAETTTIATTTQAVTTESVETTAQEDTDITENFVPATEIDDSEYITAVKNLLYSFKEADTATAFEKSIPQSTFKAMKEAEMLDYILEQINSAEIDFDQTQNVDDMEIEIISVKPADPEYVRTAGQMYSAFEGMCNTLLDAGLTYNMFINEEIPEDMTTEELIALSEKLVAYTDQENVEITVNFDFYNIVTFKANGNEAEYPVFRTAGDTAKIDLMMMGSNRN